MSNSISIKKVAKKRRVPIQTIALRAVAVAGAIGFALAAPNAGQLLKYLDRPGMTRKRIYARINQALLRLEKGGLITFEMRKGKKIAILTERGLGKIEDIMLGDYQIPEPAFWDGKWRVLIFDIPERYRLRRDELRILLRQAGFERLQDSVWVHPFPCDEFIELVRAKVMRRKGELLFFTADGLPSDHALRSHFNLS